MNIVKTVFAGNAEKNWKLFQRKLIMKKNLLDDERLKLDHYLNYSYEIITELLTASQDVKIKEIYQDMTLLHMTLIKAKQSWDSLNA